MTVHFARVASAIVILALLSVAAVGGPLAVPQARYPKLVQHAASIEGFVPAGWRIEAKETGDLDGKLHPDAALVLRETSAQNVVETKAAFGPEHFDTNPRILAVVFAEETGGFRLMLENHTLIPRVTAPNAEDPFGGGDGRLTIKRGTLQLSMEWDMGLGSHGNVTYTFRFQHGRFELVGYDSNNVTRGTGEIDMTSVNYLTGKVKLSSGRADGDRFPEKVSWKAIRLLSPPTIDQIGDGLSFDPMAH